MSEPQIQRQEQYEVKFADKDWQRLALVVFCKKSSLGRVLEEKLGIRFDPRIIGQQHRDSLHFIKFEGPAGCEKQLEKVLDVLMADFKEQKYFSKEGVAEIADQIITKGTYARSAFNAANQNNAGGNGNGPYRFTPKTQSQEDLARKIDESDITFGIGPAGTGKTHVAIAKAGEAFKAKRVKKIILARPQVEAGEKLGTLPGGVEDKLAPYMRPLYDELEKVLGRDALRRHISQGDIEIAPIGVMRGRTLENAFIVIDEAQNCTKGQIKMALTRLGPGSKIVVTGDPMQIDLEEKEDSGLRWAYERLDNEEGISLQFFDGADVVRHPVVQRVVEALDDDNEAAPGVSEKTTLRKRPGAPKI